MRCDACDEAVARVEKSSSPSRAGICSEVVSPRAHVDNVHCRGMRCPLDLSAANHSRRGGGIDDADMTKATPPVLLNKPHESQIPLTPNISVDLCGSAPEANRVIRTLTTCHAAIAIKYNIFDSPIKEKRAIR